LTFLIPLAEARVKPHQSTALHLMVAIALIGVGFAAGVLFWFTGVSPKFREAYTPFAIVSTAFFAAGILIFILAFAARKRAGSRTGRGLRLAEIALLIFGAVLFFKQGWNPPALIFAVLAVAVSAAFAAERSSNRITLRLDESGIHRPHALVRRLIPWQEVESALLRHGTLTLNLTGNRFRQHRIAEDTEVDAEIFEAWAAAQIEKGKTFRPKNDW